jgi:hypothetical protein
MGKPSMSTGRIAFSNANWALPKTTELVAILSGFLHA